MGLMMLKLQDLFELTKFEHHTIFNNVEFVWQVIEKIKPYLDQYDNWSIDGVVEAGCYLKGLNIFIHETARVEAGAYIQGPCIIGANSEVRHGAYIRGNVIVGHNCVVGHATEVKNSIFLDGAKAGHFAYIGDSILGNEVNLGAGTKLANLKIVPGNVSIVYEGKNYDTGLRKLGAIIGDYAQTGCNSVTSPGTIIGKYSLIYPAIAVKGCIVEGSIVKPGIDVFTEPMSEGLLKRIKK
jgi:UDP-N-acetylglucosamine diphosphorylase / glucose-1-phosphate thymidylyltransferase / UDP-N-acetylgalactosamine diphosphorylase / glucosamine-1-phosphate N-acetyltransferase / galactosamine-1-phosphate N-acetyltransferase